MASEKLTEYERKRLENIKRNDEMLAALKIQSKASDLSAASKRQRVATKSYKVSSQKKLKPEGPVVIRRSLRTRGMSPDFEGLRGHVVDTVNETKKTFSPVKPSPCVKGPLSFKDVYGGTGSDRVLIDTILNVGKNPYCGVTREGFDAVSVFDRKPEVGITVKEEGDGVKASKCESLSEKRDLGSRIKEEVDGSNVCRDENLSGKDDVGSCNLIKGVVKSEIKIEKSCVELGSLTLKPENIARIMQGKVLVVKFSPWTNVRMVVAGNKFGDVGFWNLDSEQEEEDGIYLYHVHTAPVSEIVFQQSCSSKIFTSSYDGFIRLMDAEKEVFNLVYSSEYSLYSLSQQPSNTNNLYFSEGSGGLNSWDVRSGKSSTEWLLHEARINTIDFNSQNPNIMATSSSDATACLWDLRCMAADKPKPLKVVNHKKAIQSAYFSPSGSSLATTSTDDKVGIWSGVNFENSFMINHNNKTGRWISNFRAIWGWDDSYMFIGNMNRGVDVISPFQRKTIMTLESPCMSAIPCRFHAHPSEVGMLAGATSGGQVYVWTTSG
ncbi:hypothetical protein JRO89_XS06G0115400 [Xanthoceras sorbifolium]|uniref:WD repeat-containing protein 76 n=1 Tax=Xanthoceras sorbifolium TaxID=99658 RepID=A0ABQ8HXW6_9ROSI|nr:hypothetical protein JRO89_XS06G0115400 [Xanthoceras sorbifolium]